MYTSRHFALSFILAITLLTAARLAVADDDSWRKPLAARNQFPPALLFIALAPERATVLGKSERSLTLNFDYSNTLLPDSAPGESLVLDLEHLSSVLEFQAGLGRGFEVGAALPIYTMYGGFLDGFISGFHKTFGIPNSLRSETPNDLFRYHYRIGEETVLGRSDGSTGIGDFRLEVKKSLTGKSENELAVRAALELPTGSRERLTGNDAVDFGLGVAASRVGRRFGGYFNLNYLILGEPERLETKNVLALMGAFDYRFKPNVAAVIQFDQFLPFLESRIKVLNQPARQLILGLRWRRSERFHYEWRFAEDLSSTSPDFTFGFQMTINSAGGK
jgi:hypothetical protein